jgi:hydroxyacylglutathione hydrolase
MILEQRAVAPFYKNGFLVACERTNDAVYIDPGDEVQDILAVVRERELVVRVILLTHGHMDHLAGVNAAKAATGAAVLVHRDDLFLYESAVEQGQMFGYALTPPPPPDGFLVEGQCIPLGDYVMTVRHTPGHSPGGVCFDVTRDGEPGSTLFVGDTLFAGSIGRTDLMRGDFPTLIASITGVLFAYPDETVVYPGHGPSTTIGRERATNPFLKDATPRR